MALEDQEKHLIALGVPRAPISELFDLTNNTPIQEGEYFISHVDLGIIKKKFKKQTEEIVKLKAEMQALNENGTGNGSAAMKTDRAMDRAAMKTDRTMDRLFLKWKERAADRDEMDKLKRNNLTLQDILGRMDSGY